MNEISLTRLTLSSSDMMRRQATDGKRTAVLAARLRDHVELRFHASRHGLSLDVRGVYAIVIGS